MTEKQILAFAEVHFPDEEIVWPTGFEKALIGITAEDESVKAVISVNKCIDILAEDMSRQEADEYFWFNIAGSHMGKHSPIYIYCPPKEGEALSPYE
tara:strand:- start:1065 stop:1355 length:291 start_codon:yes stop_codon:yes gene_type:complete